MASAGYVYVLVNPSLPNCVKIGKTTRDTATRAAELSVATGVPTPFMVAYEAYFHDCDGAESFIHAHLESKDVRLAQNREFFSITPSEAINAVIYALSYLKQGTTPESSTEEKSYADNLLNELDVSAQQQTTDHLPWQSVLDEAHLYRFGDETTIVDNNKAINLYKRAAKLGSALAYISIGEMLAEEGQVSQGFDFVKQGADKGFARCWAELADIFIGANPYFSAHITQDTANSIKCFRKFFSLNGWDGLQNHVEGSATAYLYDLLHKYLSLLNGERTQIDTNLISNAYNAFRDITSSSELFELDRLLERYSPEGVQKNKLAEIEKRKSDLRERNQKRAEVLKKYGYSVFHDSAGKEVSIYSIKHPDCPAASRNPDFLKEYKNVSEN